MKRNIVEWAVLGVSIFGIVALVAVLVVDGLTAQRPPDPRIELRPAEARTANGLGWIVPATITNAGDQAAEAVLLEATATVQGSEETAEVEVQFLPGGTAVEVAFAFSAQPSGTIEARLVSYRLP